jgi:hypothetical protein
MSLGIAAVVIFVLYLIDKNRQWKAAAKVAAVLVVLAVVGIGGVFGLDKYQAWQAVRAASARRAESVRACVDRNNRIDSSVDATTRQACEVDPDVVASSSSERPNGTFTPTDYAAKRINSVRCALDTNGRVVLDDKGGCILPPPLGFTVDAPCWTAPDSEGLQFDQNSFKTVDGRPIPPKPDRICYSRVLGAK